MVSTGEEKKLKLLVVGDSTVGKTSLALRFTRNSFIFSHIQTIGIDVQMKLMTVCGEPVMLQIVWSTQWDTAGQERYHAIHSQFFRQSHGVMIVFDAANRSSFEHIEYWLQALAARVCEKLPILLVGNKCDLPTRVISPDEGSEFASSRSLPFFETSAKDGVNVEAAFTHIASLMLPFQRASDSPAIPNGSLRLKTVDRYHPKKKSCLCQRSKS